MRSTFFSDERYRLGSLLGGGTFSALMPRNRADWRVGSCFSFFGAFFGVCFLMGVADRLRKGSSCGISSSLSSSWLRLELCLQVNKIVYI